MGQQNECKSMKERVDEALKQLPPEVQPEFFKELQIAKGVLIDLEGTLGACTKDTVSERLDACVKRMPEFKYLTEERDAAVKLVQQVCAGELSIAAGLAIIYDTDRQFTEAMVLSATATP